MIKITYIKDNRKANLPELRKDTDQAFNFPATFWKSKHLQNIFVAFHNYQILTLSFSKTLNLKFFCLFYEISCPKTFDICLQC